MHGAPNCSSGLIDCSDEDSTACSRCYTAIAWLQLPTESSRSSSTEATCLLVAASSEGIRLVSLQRCVPSAVLESCQHALLVRVMLSQHGFLVSGMQLWQSFLKRLGGAHS